jgi:uncharacterized protein
MQYRKFGKDGWKVSALGFGAMRLPVLADGTVDEDESVRMIRYGIDHGINYVDTAYMYHDGHSESVVGKALANGYREKIRIATKSPGHLIKTAQDFDRILDEQLQRLNVSKIDYYLFHGIGNSGLTQIKELKLLSRMEKARNDGRIGHIGFSFHDDAAAFKKIIDSYENWDFCQIQYNYMDINNQAGRDGLLYAANKGISVVIMEPLLGGRLTRPPEPVATMFKNSIGSSRTPAEWSLQWIWNHSEVSTILSGMSTMEQVLQNVAAAEKSQSDSLDAAQLAFIEQIRNEFSKRTVVPCTKCNYCMPCPYGVIIPWILDLYNQEMIYEDPNFPRYVYNTFVKPENRASECIGCKACESRCPQKIKISEWMPKIQAVMGERKE